MKQTTPTKTAVFPRRHMAPATPIRRESIEEFLDRDGVITRVPPSLAKNYLDDASLVDLLLGYRLDETLDTEQDRVSRSSVVRDGQRDRRVTDADWN